MVLALESYEGESISIELPTTVDLEVIKTDPGFAGDTATNASKPAIVSTGTADYTTLLSKQILCNKAVQPQPEAFHRTFVEKPPCDIDRRAHDN